MANSLCSISGGFLISDTTGIKNYIENTVGGKSGANVCAIHDMDRKVTIVITETGAGT